MKDIRLVSLAVFAASFLIGFLIFEADNAHVSGKDQNLQLSMMPLFTSINSIK
ncbi:MAG: hypothetical protein GY927_06225 [bacterium]|nr:hypothetical protein [bacterium]